MISDVLFCDADSVSLPVKYGSFVFTTHYRRRINQLTLSKQKQEPMGSNRKDGARDTGTPAICEKHGSFHWLTQCLGQPGGGRRPPRESWPPHHP